MKYGPSSLIQWIYFFLNIYFWYSGSMYGSWCYSVHLSLIVFRFIASPRLLLSFRLVSLSFSSIEYSHNPVVGLTTHYSADSGDLELVHRQRVALLDWSSVLIHLLWQSCNCIRFVILFELIFNDIVYLFYYFYVCIFYVFVCYLIT